MTTRILYESVDHPHPSGGIRRLYRHVEILRAHGIAASILHHTPGFRLSWFTSDAPIEYWDDAFRFAPTDILVIPEGHTDVMEATAGLDCERVVIALNWANIHRRLPIGTDWRTWGITRVIAGSQYEQQFIRDSMGIESAVLASGTDAQRFRETGPKRLQIAYMPRKNAIVFHAIACIFRSRCPQWEHVPFVPIDGVSHEEVARVMTESAIFLATSFPEGLARPPLEAMASGCLVVGFAGMGSLEYMHDGVNCYRANDLDVLTVARSLDDALTSVVEGRASRMKAAARATALQYSLEREERAVVAYWRGVLAGRRPAALADPRRGSLACELD